MPTVITVNKTTNSGKQFFTEQLYLIQVNNERLKRFILVIQLTINLKLYMCMFTTETERDSKVLFPNHN